MVESGHVDLQKVYTDGTKIESSANRYTFVWGRAIKASKERIARQLEELWAYTQGVAAQEMADTLLHSLIARIRSRCEKQSKKLTRY